MTRLLDQFWLLYSTDVEAARGLDEGAIDDLTFEAELVTFALECVSPGEGEWARYLQETMRRLADAGFNVGNQMVLLRGINDTPEVRRMLPREVELLYTARPEVLTGGGEEPVCRDVAHGVRPGDRDDPSPALLEKRQSLPELDAYKDAHEREQTLASEIQTAAAELKTLELEFDKSEGELQILESKLNEHETRLFAGGMSARETEHMRLEVQSLHGQQEALDVRRLARHPDRVLVGARVVPADVAARDGERRWRVRDHRAHCRVRTRARRTALAHATAIGRRRRRRS